MKVKEAVAYIPSLICLFLFLKLKISLKWKKYADAFVIRTFVIILVQ